MNRGDKLGLFDKLFSKYPAPPESGGYFKLLTTYSPVFTSWHGNLYESELVRSAIDARARHAAKLRVEVIGQAKPKLQTKIRRAPNSFQTWYQFMYRLSTILDMQNTAFIVPIVEKLNPDSIVGYFPIMPTQCAIVQDEDGNPWLRYKFSSGATAAIEYGRCGIMTKFQYSDDVFGESNTALNSTTSLIDLQDQGINEAVKSGANYMFMAKVNNFSKTDDLRKERERFSEENFRADSKAGGLLLFPNNYTDIKQITANPYVVDAPQRELIQRNVYNYFGVNEDILQNKAFGDSWTAFYEGAIEPFAIQFSEVMTNMTFSDAEFSHGSRIMAIANRMQYMDNNAKLNMSSQMADRGIMSINEIREVWNLEPVEGGDIRVMRGEYKNADEDGTEGV